MATPSRYTYPLDDMAPEIPSSRKVSGLSRISEKEVNRDDFRNQTGGLVTSSQALEKSSIPDSQIACSGPDR